MKPKTASASSLFKSNIDPEGRKKRHILIRVATDMCETKETCCESPDWAAIPGTARMVKKTRMTEEKLRRKKMKQKK